MPKVRKRKAPRERLPVDLWICKALGHCTCSTGKVGKHQKKKKSKVPARVYAISKEEVDKDADDLEGMILGKLAKVLLDHGSTHSLLVRPKFIQELGLKMKKIATLGRSRCSYWRKKIYSGQNLKRMGRGNMW